MVDELPVVIVNAGSKSRLISRKAALPEPPSQPDPKPDKAPPANAPPRKRRLRSETVMLSSFEKATRILAVSDDILSEAEKLSRVQALLVEYKDVLFPVVPVVEETGPKARKPRGKVTDPEKLERMRAVAAKARAARAAKLAAAAASLV